MAAERNIIPVHKLMESTDQGFQIERIHRHSNAAEEALLVRRDGPRADRTPSMSRLR